MEFLRRTQRRVIDIDKVSVLSKVDKQVIKALINALSLQKKVLPLAENPLTIELLDPDMLKLSPKEFMKQTLLSKPFARIVSFIVRVMRGF